LELSAVVSEAMDLVKPLADERGITLQAEWTRTECVGDPERLGQVFTNLLTNAVVHQQSGGRVTVHCGVESGLAVVSVVDRGPGIPPEQLPKLFERFHRGDSSRAQQSGGTGLGLAISKAIVEAHGGSIRVQSVVGQGSTFEVRLPLGSSGLRGSVVQ
jgi:signal transduction histidine kinase